MQRLPKWMYRGILLSLLVLLLAPMADGCKNEQSSVESAAVSKVAVLSAHAVHKVKEESR